MDIFHLFSFKLRIIQQLREAYNKFNLSNFVIEKEGFDILLKEFGLEREATFAFGT